MLSLRTWLLNNCTRIEQRLRGIAFRVEFIETAVGGAICPMVHKASIDTLTQRQALLDND